MRKKIITLVLFTSVLVSAQSHKQKMNVLTQTNVLELKSLAAKYYSDYNNLLSRINILKKSDNNVANQPIITGFMGNKPLFLSFQTNADANRTANADLLTSNSTIPGGVAVNGSGITAFVWDGGSVRGTHQELNGRVTNMESIVTIADHATAVAGTLGATGIVATAKGVASLVSIKSYDVNNNYTEIATESANGAILSNHSYGTNGGWVGPNANYSGTFIGSSSHTGWYWFGDNADTVTESNYFGDYYISNRNYDQIIYNAPMHTMVKSAGNSRGHGPAAGTVHWIQNANGDFVESTMTRPKNCAQTGYDCLTLDGSAKNIILVGAVSAIATRYSQPSDVAVAAFSSFGPTDDGRIKPDLVAVGVSAYSSTAASDTSYSIGHGTSYSSPSVAGVVALEQELYNKNNGQYMRSDMVKALLTHTANKANASGAPDYKSGWGLVNALGAAQTIIDKGTSALFHLGTLSAPSNVVGVKAIGGSTPLKASLVWVDPPATGVPGDPLNNRTKMLVNDLDLRIIETATSTINYPWKLDVENPGNAATKGNNDVDNIEQVLIETPTANGVYNITISKCPACTFTNQNYALLVTGITNNTLGVDEVVLSEDNFKLYPNPVVNSLKFNSKNTIKNVQIQIIDEVGKLIKNEIVPNFNSNTVIDVANLPGGLYLLGLKYNSHSFTTKFIKN